MFPFVRITILGLPLFIWIYILAASVYAGLTWPVFLRRGFTWLQVLWMMIAAVLLAIVGGKLFALVDGWYYYIRNPDELLEIGGHGWNGVFTMVTLGMGMVFLLWKKKVLRHLDTLVLYAPLGISIGRIGCLITADGDYGTATTLPWGMTFKYGYFPTQIPVHPTPIYEMLVMIPLFIVLRTKVFDRLADGWTLTIYLAVYAVERFAIELIRWNRVLALGMTEAQWLCIIYLIAAVAIATRLLRRRTGTGTGTGAGTGTGTGTEAEAETETGKMAVAQS